MATGKDGRFYDPVFDLNVGPINIVDVYNLVASFENVVADHKENNKNTLREIFQQKMEDINDTAVLMELADRVGEYIDRINNPVDLIQTDDSVYIRYLKNNVKYSEDD